MPTLNALEHKHLRQWETVAEVVWKRYPAAVRFQQRKEISLVNKRIGPKGNDAVLERSVVYDYSENIPLFLKTFVGNGERFIMNEKLTYNWAQRKLEVEVTNETSKGPIRYTERTSFTVHPDNEMWTLARQTGFYEIDLMFGVDQMAVSLIEDIYHLNFTHNRDADMSLMEEMSKGSSKEVVGYFPSYLRTVFLEDHEPASLPPPPPAAMEARARGLDAPKSAGFKLDLNMDPNEAKRKLAWMFAPTPPLTKKVHGDKDEISVDIPSRLGKKGAAFSCLQPRFATMHTFAEQGMTGPVAPPLEIYGATQEAQVDDASKRAGAGKEASSLVMF